MSIKRETLLCGILCLFVIIPAFADSGWLLAQTDRDQYFTGDDMEISGLVLDRTMPEIGIRIYDPDGKILGAYGVELELDDSFSKTIALDSPFYDQSGLYVIEFIYGDQSDEIFFEVIGSAPEPIPTPTLAPEVLVITTDKNSYADNEFVTISGLVSDVGDPTILIGIFDPSDFPTGFYTPQISSELEFTVSFLAKSSVNFKKPGEYTVKAHYGQSKQETTFRFVDTQNNPSPTPPTPIVPPQIILNPAPKQETQTPAPKPVVPKSVVAPKPVEMPKPTLVTQNTLKTEPQKPAELSVEEKEIGQMLNEITLKCDNSYYTDSIVYGQGMGAALMRLCNYDQAVDYFDRSLLKDPDNPEILTNKGSALARQGLFREALENYNLALKKDPNFTPALNNKANALAETGKLEDAITLYNKILDKDPTSIIAKQNLQKAREETIQLAKMQVQQKQESISVSLDESIPKIESQKVNYEMPKQTTVIDQIGSFIAGIFGFLK